MEIGATDCNETLYFQEFNGFSGCLRINPEMKQKGVIGAESRTRTGTRLLAPDFESGVSTSFTTSAKVGREKNN